MASLWELENETKAWSFAAVPSSLKVVDQRPCQQAALNTRIQDPGRGYTFDHYDVVRAKFNGSTIMRGDVSRYVRANTGQAPRVYDLVIRDFTARLKRDVLTSDRNVIESVVDRVEWIMSHCTRRISTLGVVDDYSDDLDPLKSKGMTVLEALAQTAGEVGASFYVSFETAGDPDDFDGDLQFFTILPANAAPFDLRSSSSPDYDPDADPPIAVVSIDEDSENHALRVYVNGDGVGIWVEDSAGIIAWNAAHPGVDPPEFAINDSSVTTEGQATRLGTAALELLKAPIVRASLVLKQPGIEPMQTARLDARTNWSDNADFVVAKTTTTFASLTRLQMAVELESRFTPCYVRKVNLAQQGTTPKPDCTDCGRRVALLEDGMDSNLSMARGQAGMHLYDSISLSAYNCNLERVRHKASAPAALPVIHHESGIYTGLLAGDRVFHLDPDLGPYGTERWSIDDAITAADVMDVRKFWAVAAGLAFDDLNRTEPGPDIGVTSGGALVWLRFQHTISGSAPSTEVDGTHLHYLRTATGLALSDTMFYLLEDDQFWSDYDFDVTVEFEIANLPQGYQKFQLCLGDVSGAANGGQYDDRGAYAQLRVGTSAANPSEATAWVLNVGNTIATDVDEALSFDPRGAGPLSLRWQHNGTVSRAKLWVSADPEPDWGDPDTVERTDVDDDLLTGNLFGLYFTHKAFVSGENFEVRVDAIVPTGGASGLQSRSMVDGSLIASTALPNPTDQIRRTPNGQHVFVLQDAELRRYNRAPTLEDTISLPDFYDGLQDWNVDDAYNIYWLGGGVLKRYDIAGELEWTKDLFALYGYRFPSRVTIANGYGMQVQTVDNKLRVVGYVGEADWQDGSEALLLSLHPASGALIRELRYGGQDGSAAQAQALVPYGACLWLAGAADGAQFEDNALSGLKGWAVKDEAGDAGGVVSVVIADEAP